MDKLPVQVILKMERTRGELNIYICVCVCVSVCMVCFLACAGFNKQKRIRAIALDKPCFLFEFPPFCLGYPFIDSNIFQSYLSIQRIRF
jgi:hypothetical protein